ncbi:hypothetical protein [Streptomyces sp. CB03911]|uniref:hypothetical protein n=1 Tax=Streptomyces sp. CB03911 TaxID=1804758 RepID=UPI00093EAB47|nr:hypothetical protein [Streptomyces sp. CB03911]
MASRPRTGRVVSPAAGAAGLMLEVGGVGPAWGLTGSGSTRGAAPAPTAAATFTGTGTHW